MARSSAAAIARLRFLDASRGATMFFVFLSHFAWLYFTGPEQQGWRTSLIRIGMIATPTFVILSGMVLGELLFGSLRPTALPEHSFPIVPWFAVYLAAYLYWVGLYPLMSPGGPGRGVVYFALSATALILAAHVWQHYHGNRFFTVRYAIGSERFAEVVPRLRLETVPVMW
jgi:uncharacterized membrane protein